MPRLQAPIAVLLVAVLFANVAPAADPTLTQTRTLAIEHMLDSEGDAALSEFAAAHLAPEYRAAFADESALLNHLREIRAAVAPVFGVGLAIDEDGVVRLHVSNPEHRSIVALRLQDAEPRLITSLVLESVEAKDTGPQVTWDTLESTLEDAAAAGFSGSVLAVRGGEVVLDRGFGFADPEGRHPVTPETLFAIGSTPIDFTHGALLLLAQEGALSLDDPLTRFFDDVPADKRGITLEQLRTGRSGLIDFPGIPGVDENLDLSWIDRAEFLRRVFAAPLLFAPGTDEQHSHCAWDVLAAVIEIVSGETYETYLRRRFFEPADMTRTGHYPLARRFPASEVAVGLGGNTWGGINSPSHWGETSWLVLGSGGMVSTPGDLRRWRDFVSGGGVLDEASRRRYGVDGIFLAEGGNDRGFINTIGARGGDLVIVCSNSQVEMDDATAQLALAVARLGTGE